MVPAQAGVALGTSAPHWRCMKMGPQDTGGGITVHLRPALQRSHEADAQPHGSRARLLLSQPLASGQWLSGVCVPEAGAARRCLRSRPPCRHLRQPLCPATLAVASCLACKGQSGWREHRCTRCPSGLGRRPLRGAGREVPVLRLPGQTPWTLGWSTSYPQPQVSRRASAQCPPRGAGLCRPGGC